MEPIATTPRRPVNPAEALFKPAKTPATAVERRSGPVATETVSMRSTAMCWPLFRKMARAGRTASTQRFAKRRGFALIRQRGRKRYSLRPKVFVREIDRFSSI